MTIWLLIKSDKDGNKKLLNVNLKKKPLVKEKETTYQNAPDILVERQDLSVNQDMAYFGWLLEDIADFLDRYINTYLDYHFRKNDESFKEEQRMWAVRKILERKDEIERLAHMIMRNDVSDKKNLLTLMKQKQLEHQNISAITCANFRCNHWKRLRGIEGTCGRITPKLDMNGKCINIE